MPITLDGTNGITTPTYGGADTSEYLVPVTQFKNRIINGAMGIWQRGTSYSLTNSYVYGCADRWETDMGSTAACTASQSTSVPTAIAQYSLKLQRTASSTSTGTIVMAQALETANSYDMAGKTATLSFYAKAGSNFSASSSALNALVFFGQGTDQSISSMRSNSWTNQTNSGGTATLTTSWQQFSFTVSVPAGTTQVGMQIYWTPTGTAGADDSVFVTGVQLEVGSTATSFDYRPYGTELALCQRYYFRQKASDGDYYFSGQGFCDASTQAQVVINFPVIMRTAPTSLEQSGTAGDYRFRVSGANVVFNSVPTFLLASTYSGSILGNTASGLSPNSSFILRSVNSNAYLGWSAEL